MTNRFFAISLAAAMLIGGVLTGCKGDEKGGTTGGGEASKGDKIKIGLVASLTGDQKPWGADSEMGAKIAVEEFNKAGGMNGKMVELLVEDSASKPESAKTAAGKLVSDGVAAIVGEVSSGNTEQIKIAAADKGIPVIAIGATKTTLTAGTDKVFRVCYIDDFQGPAMAKFAFEDQGVKSIAIITDKKLPYSQGLTETFRKYYEKLGGKVVKEVSYQSGDTQFSSLVTELKSSAPAGIFMSGYFTEVGPLAKEIRNQGITVPMYGGDGWDSEQILTSGGDAIIGSYFCNHYSNKEERPEVKEFLEKYKLVNDGKEPSTTMGALAYDAMKLTLTALKATKTGSSSEIREAVDNTEKFPGVTGEITLKGRHGNPAKRALIVKIASLKDGFLIPAKSMEYFDQ